MVISKRSAFFITFSVIILYWLYTFFILAGNPPEMPDNLNDIFFSILKSKLILLAVIILLLRLEGDWLYQMGFRKEGITIQIITGIIFGFAIWILINLMINPVMNSINPSSAEKGTDMMKYMKDMKSIFLWIPVIFIASFTEEFQRIFVLTRFEKWFGNFGLYLALIVSSVAFGIGHLYQGINPAIGTAVGGLLYGLVYIRKRSAVEVITCHTFFNLLSVIGGYMMNNK